MGKGRFFFFKEISDGNQLVIWKKDKTGSISHVFQLNKFQMDQHLNVKKSIQALKNMGEFLYKLGYSKTFLTIT